MGKIKPEHYKLNVKGVECDYFDIANAMELSLEQFTALRYFRKKGGIEKQINDTEKAIQCLNRYLERLKNIRP